MAGVRPTVTASTMIARFNFGRKGRCHKGVVENLRPQEFSPGVQELRVEADAWCRFLRAVIPIDSSPGRVADSRP
jgi:hypothetical protein